MIVGIGACFIAWASLFIYHSSFVGIDGWRYFCLFDDAMISMRYAWNFSHGLGLVWNPGEYVEGYTNFLITLLMALATLLFDKVDAVLAIQILGIIFMLANAYLIMSIAEHLISRQKRYHQLFRVLAFLCALSYYPLLYWSLMGMETGLLVVLLSLSILSALRYARDRRPAQGVLLSVSLGLAFLTRPDTVVLAIPIFVYAFYPTRKSERGPSLSFLLKVLGLYVVFIAGQELFRWGYYGEWLPNTYALKVSGIPLLARIWNGANFIWPFLKEIYVLLIVVGAGVVFAFRRDKLFLAGLFVVLVGYQVWAGGDPSIYWRLLSPAVPIMLVLGVYEILMVLQYVSETARIRRYFLRNPALPRVHVLGVLACLLVLGMLWSVNSRFLPEMAMLSKFNAVRTNEERVNVALVVEQLTTPDATVGVFDAGAIPYYSGRPSIDFLGKMDRRIAWLPPDLSGATSNPLNEEMIYTPGHNRYNLEYSIKELKPTYARSFTWGGQNVVDWAKSEYVTVVYKGVRVNFLKGSEDVRWDSIEAARQAGEATLATPKW
ncbi:MAG: glycosyltransferase family 39 protein [Rubrobacter sp.]|nr:glycosyltransferase family 39 protein [Rubrobacter sp.]